MIRLCVQEMALDRGLRQTDLVKRSNLSHVTVGNYWHNRVRNISMDVLEALGAVIGVSGTNLLTDVPLPAKPSSPPPSQSLMQTTVDVQEALITNNIFSPPPTEEIPSSQNVEHSFQQIKDENQFQMKQKLGRKAKKRLKKQFKQDEDQGRRNNSWHKWHRHPVFNT